ncbi:MAG: SRPBCC family protein [Acidimicrobiaceae bacterium]|nr:SRPBCC family protein [Acidimicrobiaceae bacterium]
MPARQKVLGLPIGRRRRSPIPKVAAGGGAALALAVPAVVKGRKLARPVQEKVKKVEDLTNKASDLAGPARKASDAVDTVNRARSAVTSGLTGSGGGSGGEEGGGQGGSRGSRTPDKGVKTTNIVESVDVGVPVHTAYDIWTRFTEFPSFMKKVESVEQESDETLNWTARIAWSNRTWKAEILEQVPDHKIVWRSEGSKGYVDGAVTFHELAPELTKVVVVLEYHPQGLFEKTANLWRAQGRRARLELKNFERHAMTEVALRPEPPEGWRGEIHEGNVVETGQSDEAEDDERHDDAGSDGDSEDTRASDEQNRREPEHEERAEQDEDSERDQETEQDEDPERDEASERDQEGERDQRSQRDEDSEYDDEEGQQNGQVRASSRSQSQPMRRRQTSPDGDGDEEGSRSTARRGARSAKNEGSRQGRDRDSGDEGRGGRVVGSRSERRVGQR